MTPDEVVVVRDGPSPWWRSAVVYQVYIRSFADGNGDGTGDIAGLRDRLGYVRDLGVDALWVTAWYHSPLVDGGYDVADHRAIHPAFGTLAEAEALVTAAHDCGLRVIVDLIPNHTSDQHAWFRAALDAGPASADRGRYIFREGRGLDGQQPPNNWRSVFGGPAWTRVPEEDGTGRHWYLHLFHPSQPDLNWTSRDVWAEFDDVMRFWLDRGIDGFRVDVAPRLVKHPDLPDLADGAEVDDHPYWDRDGVHDIFRAWRGLCDPYDGERLLVGEVWVTDPKRLARYVRPDELHAAFTFDFLRAPWDPAAMRQAIDANLAALDAVGAPPAWVLSNHDVPRVVTRYGRPPGRERSSPGTVGCDAELGLRRARAAALLMLALPGSAYVYQGEELGLIEVEDVPDQLLQDPAWERSKHTNRGRDGCRVPLPWGGQAPPFQFGAASAWLPQPLAWEPLTVAAQLSEPTSTLQLYRAALAIRRGHPALGDGILRWVDGPGQTLVFDREPGFRCMVNMGTTPVALRPDLPVLLASGPLGDATLPPDGAVWLRRC